jgi:hypothetical protein
MHSSYKRLVNANPKARLSVAHFLEQGRRSGAFFDTPLIKLTEGVDNLGVKSETEREAFLELVFIPIETICRYDTTNMRIAIWNTLAMISLKTFSN